MNTSHLVLQAMVLVTIPSFLKEKELHQPDPRVGE